MYCILAVTLCLIVQTYGETTELPSSARPHSGHHHNHEANEFDQAMFYYDALSHRLVMKIGGNCYLEALSRHQRPHVHTSDGLANLELNFMSRISKGTKTLMDHNDVMKLSQHVEHMCAGTTVYVLNGHSHHHAPTTMST